MDESTDTWDTIDWLVKNVPCNNGRVGMWGISYPGFYVSAGMIDAHPALKAVSPQAPVTDYYLGDDSFHNGAFMLAANFGFYTGFPVRPKPERPQPRVPLRLRHAQRLRVLPADGPALVRRRALRRAGQPLLPRQSRTHRLRRVLEGAGDLEALQGHHPGGAHRGRLVRRRGHRRAAPHLQDAEGRQPDDEAPPGDGPVDARQLGARRRPGGGEPRFRRRGLGVVSRARGVPVLHAAPEGQDPRAGGRSDDVRDRDEPVAHVRGLAAADRARRRCIWARAGRCRPRRRWRPRPSIST